LPTLPARRTPPPFGALARLPPPFGALARSPLRRPFEIRTVGLPQLDRRHMGLVALAEAQRQKEHQREGGEEGEQDENALGGHECVDQTLRSAYERVLIAHESPLMRAGASWLDG
jgi:hypothetical protein